MTEKITNTKAAEITTVYTSIRVETYKRGEGKRVYKFDARNEEAVAKAKTFANEAYKAQKKVTMYTLEKLSNGEWKRSNEKSADGRPDSEKRAKKTAKTAKTTKTNKSAKTKKTPKTNKTAENNKTVASLLDKANGKGITEEELKVLYAILSKFC